MNANSAHDGGPPQFARNWLQFNENRPFRPRLLRRFVVLLTILLSFSALLAIVGAFMR